VTAEPDNRERCEERPGETPGAEPPIEELLDRLRADLAQAEGNYKRALADLQNFRRRSLLNEQESRAQGVRSVLQGILGSLDHLDLALAQDPASVPASAIIDGVRTVRDELLRSLASFGVSRIEPAPGDAFDPASHEAVVHAPAEGVHPGGVVRTLQVGYALGERVMRPAKVAVAAEPNQE
jgi:molecular chaperone GrpE